MSKLLVNKVVQSFMKSNTDLDDYAQDAVTRFLFDAIEKGTLVINEPSNPYTFGGVTVDLTDSQFATVIAFTSNRRKIQAIKEIRNASGGFGHPNSVSLTEAKDFVDHLSVILDLSESVDVPYGY